MLMTHAAISDGSIGLPRFGPTAEAVPAPRPSASTTAKRASLRINMFHLPIALDRPTGNAVEVLARKARYGRDTLGLAAFRHDLGACRWHVAAFVRCAAIPIWVALQRT